MLQKIQGRPDNRHSICDPQVERAETEGEAMARWMKSLYGVIHPKNVSCFCGMSGCRPATLADLQPIVESLGGRIVIDQDAVVKNLVGEMKREREAKP